MSEEQLRTLAESLDIKGTKKMDSAIVSKIFECYK